MIHPYVLIGILGSIASIISCFLAAPTLKSRAVHVVYAIILTIVVGSSVLSVDRYRLRLEQAGKAQSELQSEIQELKSLKSQARALLQTRPYSTSDKGDNRGSILAGLAFLEANKSFFPELYSTAKELCLKGIKVTETTGKLDYDEEGRLKDGADAMRSMLKGLAGEK